MKFVQRFLLVMNNGFIENKPERNNQTKVEKQKEKRLGQC
jgi:hypothetical protein